MLKCLNLHKKIKKRQKLKRFSHHHHSLSVIARNGAQRSGEAILLLDAQIVQGIVSPSSPYTLRQGVWYAVLVVVEGIVTFSS